MQRSTPAHLQEIKQAPSILKANILCCSSVCFTSMNLKLRWWNDLHILAQRVKQINNGTKLRKQLRMLNNTAPTNITHSAAIA